MMRPLYNEQACNAHYPVVGFPSGQREQTVNLPSSTSKVRILPPPPSHDIHALPRGGVPERPKGADCKSAVIDFEGSNPSPTTILFVNFFVTYSFIRLNRVSAQLSITGNLLYFSDIALNKRIIRAENRHYLQWCGLWQRVTV